MCEILSTSNYIGEFLIEPKNLVFKGGEIFMVYNDDFNSKLNNIYILWQTLYYMMRKNNIAEGFS